MPFARPHNLPCWLFVVALVCFRGTSFATEPPPEVTPEKPTRAQTQRLCEDHGGDVDACVSACTTYAAEPRCRLWLRFGETGAKLLAEAKPGEDARELEKKARASGVSKEEARYIRWYGTAALQQKDPSLAPSKDLADDKLRGDIDQFFASFEGDEIAAATGVASEYGQYISVYDELLPRLIEELGAEHIRVMRFALIIGKYSLLVSDRERAHGYLEIAARAANKLLPREHPWRAEANFYALAARQLIEADPNTPLTPIEAEMHRGDRALGRYSSRYFVMRLVFGRVLLARGEFGRARLVFFEWQRDMSRLMSKHYPVIGLVCVYLAEAVARDGDLLYAQSLLLKAKRSMSKNPSNLALWIPYHSVYSLQQRLWGKAFSSDEAKATALDHAHEALTLARQQLGEGNPELWEHRRNLALAYQAQGRIFAAKKIHKMALAEVSKVHGDENRKVLQSRRDLAFIFIASGNNKRALEHYTTSTPPAIKQDAITYFDHMALAYHLDGQIEPSLVASRKSLELRRGLIWEQILDQKDTTRTAFALRNTYETLFHTLTLEEADLQAQFETILNWHGTGLAIAKEKQRRIIALSKLAGKDADARDAWEAHRNGTAFLDPKALELAHKRLEAQGIELTGAPPEHITRVDLCEDLAKRDTWLVLYRAHLRVDAKSSRAGVPKDSRFYYAYVLSPECRLHRQNIAVAPLFEADLKTWRNQVTVSQECFKKHGTPFKCLKAFAKMDALSEHLYAHLFKRIEDKLTGANKLLVVPDGTMATVAFEGIVNPSTKKYLIEERQIDLLTSPHALLETSRPTKATRGNDSALIVGDLDYDHSAPSAAAAMAGWQVCEKGKCDRSLTKSLPKKALKKRLARASTRGSKDGETPNCGVGLKWAPLRTEASAVAEMLGAHLSDEVVLIRGDTALESIVRDAMNQKRFIHLATHGFYASKGTCFEKMSGGDSIEILDRILEEGVRYDSMRQVSLVLSGVSDISARRGSGEDGFLDGSELGDLDLSQTELVSLSACETGLGIDFAGDGIHAMARAFIEAGAHNVINSLWQVPDASTRDLFIDFYTRYTAPSAKLTHGEALRQAKLVALKKARDSGLTHSAFMWAAFPLLVGK